MEFSWKDYSLRWNLEEYGHQIFFYIIGESVDENFDSTTEVNAVVQFLIFHIFLDTQICTLKFGSRTYDEAEVNLTAESNKGQLDAYVKSAEWNLEGIYDYLRFFCNT
ncbi:unnamed protein product [Adineta steineri]|uniref:Neurotransmitter-gated ion-channel ligand-binding domain-containing protein n=1 Tax=Adineta steineri TaxID=433720 RepID=A0A815NMW0_9BILA|nr:unnamed protein product [Adineta steineri]CAF1627361.1 unnamed protein product [Adineta steineri]